MNEPDSSALRAALWRALHVFVDQAPLVFEDTIGYKLIGPEEGWQNSPDMLYTRRLRASVVARSRFIEDLAHEQIGKGVRQYVLLGAGLDSFYQRNPELHGQIDVYEIDQAATLAWKKQQLIAKGFPTEGGLHFVPSSFEEQPAKGWWNALIESGFQPEQPAFVSCTGVSLYLSQSAIVDLLKSLRLLAKGSLVSIAFYLPIEELEKEDQPVQEIANKGARESGTPFVSFVLKEDMLALAHDLGLKQVSVFTTDDMRMKYFSHRSDGLIPASGEFFLQVQL